MSGCGGAGGCGSRGGRRRASACGCCWPAALLVHQNRSLCMDRSYHGENRPSHQHWARKHHWARPVVRWGTTCEPLVTICIAFDRRTWAGRTATAGGGGGPTGGKAGSQGGWHNPRKQHPAPPITQLCPARLARRRRSHAHARTHARTHARKRRAAGTAMHTGLARGGPAATAPCIPSPASSHLCRPAGSPLACGTQYTQSAGPYGWRRPQACPRHTAR